MILNGFETIPLFGWIGCWFCSCLKWLEVYWNPLHCEINRQIKSKIDGMNGKLFQHVLNTQSSLFSIPTFLLCVCLCAFLALCCFSKLLNWHYVTRVHRNTKGFVSTACFHIDLFAFIVNCGYEFTYYNQLKLVNGIANDVNCWLFQFPYTRSST